jgi:ribosomal protein L11 methyltransferase
MSIWLECSTLVEAEAVDAVAELFSRVGQGVAIEEPVVSSADGEQVGVDSNRPVVVKTYLPRDERADEVRRQLDQAVWHLGRLRRVEPLQVRTLSESDWADAWKQHFFVNRVGQRLVIVPSWRTHRPRAGDVCLQLDPGMAFGTGLHPTTALCLRAMERWIQGTEEVLDLGTGSGVLAIAAAKLGARRVLALDIDPPGVRVAAENVARNGLDNVIEVRLGTLPLPAADQTFDLIVANISLTVLRDMHDVIRRALRPAGVALFSGVLEADAPRLLHRATLAGWRPIEQRTEAEWTLLVMAPTAA